jgi:NCS2 family nucleobase:cation symporter-2
MTIFLFANVLTSGINLTSQVDLNSRRNKFIMAWSLAIGVGVSVWPYAFQDRRASPYTAAFWTCADCGAAMQGVRNGISIFLSTGYCVGTVCAMLLNSILPADAPVSYDEHDPMVVHREKSHISDDEDGDETTDKISPSLDKQPEAPVPPSEDGEAEVEEAA